ncbi:MAG: protein O-mannosyl-transferase family, partial [Candidatus Krumholzibacteriia bacterium]
MRRDSAILAGTDGGPAGRLLPLVAGCGAAALYVATVAPDLTAGDSGELATAAAVWGLAHPPAYPLWTALAHLWIRLLAPAGFSPVAATNLLSGVLTALAVGLAAATRRRLTGSALAALAAAAALAACGPVWAGAVVTEVYALLLLLLVALAATLLAAPPREAGAGRLCAAGALAGLAVTAHQLALLPLLVAAPWFARAARTPRRAAWVALGGVIGLSPLLLVPLRAAASPELRWGWQGAADLWRYLGRAI